MSKFKPTAKQISKVVEAIKAETTRTSTFVFWEAHKTLMGLFENCKTNEEVEKVSAEILKMDFNLGLSCNVFFAYKNGTHKEFQTREEAEAFSNLVEEIHREPAIQYNFNRGMRGVIEDIKNFKRAEFEEFEIHQGSEQIKSRIEEIFDYVEEYDKGDVMKLIGELVEEVRKQAKQGHQ